jgi:hypothetical protein
MAIQRIHWNLLGEWWCVPITATAAEVVAAIAKEVSVPGPIEDRLYGGFPCQDPTNRHVAFDTGAYFYTSETNLPLMPEDRQKTWAKLIEMSNSPGNGFIGGGPCCEDAPVPVSAPDERRE